MARITRLKEILWELLSTCPPAVCVLTILFLPLSCSSCYFATTHPRLMRVMRVPASPFGASLCLLNHIKIIQLSDNSNYIWGCLVFSFILDKNKEISVVRSMLYTVNADNAVMFLAFAYKWSSESEYLRWQILLNIFTQKTCAMFVLIPFSRYNDWFPLWIVFV